MTKRVFAFWLCVVWLCAGSGCQTPVVVLPPAPAPSPGGVTAAPATPAPTPASDADWTEARVGAYEDTRLLELVSRDHPIRDGGAPYPAVPAYRTVPLAGADILVHPRALEAAEALFTQAEAEGFDGFFIASGYRTYEKQQQLYGEADDKAYVQKPNHSEHQTGLAVDIAYTGIGQRQLGDSAEGLWLSQNAWTYGFVLRYPEGKSDVTGIAFEPWHFRYVGQPHAAYCYENDLCLEEYIQLLKDSGGYRTTLEGQTYSVFYERPRGDVIRVPKEGRWELSGDNTGGYILTVREA
jgi:D-alanyl-D-alanine carboxypeptidase